MTGYLASRTIRSMLPSASAISPATVPSAVAVSGAPSTVTRLRPARRRRLSPRPSVISTSSFHAAAQRCSAIRNSAGSRGAVTSTPSTKRPRSTICSMSATRAA